MKSYGFRDEKLLVLPEQLQAELAKHELISDLYVTDIGYFPEAWHHYRERPEGADCHILILCAQGAGWVECQGEKPQPVTPHSFVVIPAGLPHRYGADAHEPWSIYWFHFRGQTAGAIIREFSLDKGVLHLPMSAYVQVTELFVQVYEQLSVQAYSLRSQLFVSRTSAYLLALIGASAMPAPGKRTSAEMHVTKAVALMEERLTGSVTLPELARAAGLSKPHLIDLFHQVYGYPPIDYFLRLKIQLACKLLDLSDLALKEVAAQVGIGDPYYFSRLFKKIMGMPPSVYKRIPKG